MLDFGSGWRWVVITAVTLWIEGCVGCSQCRSVWSGSREKQFSLPSLELQTIQYAASRYTYCIIPTISHNGSWNANDHENTNLIDEELGHADRGEFW
jgi:hypothetical protein